MNVMRRPGGAWLLSGAVAVIAAACTVVQDDDDEDDLSLLMRSPSAIAADALSETPSKEYASMHGRVASRVTKERQTYLASFPLGASRGSALVSDPRIRQARAEAAAALNVALDRSREDDAASAQQGIDALHAQVTAIAPGATSCSVLGARAERCVVALLIIEVQRSQLNANPATPPMVDAGTSPPLDAGPSSPDPADPVEGGAAAVDPTTTASDPASTSGACTASVDAPASLCAMPDAYEPNDSESAARELSLQDNCGVVAARLDKDEDHFAFVPERSDPVRVQLAYTAVGDADLNTAVYDFNGSFEGSAESTRTTPSETEAFVFRAVANRRFTARVRGGTAATCQPYHLSVNTAYCADAYEDNDTSATAAELQLDAAGVVELNASSHHIDEDFYQVVVPKSDPIRVTASYAVPADGADLSLSVYSRVDTFLASHDKTRNALEETMSAWVDAEGANALYRIRIRAQGGDCTPYKLKLEAAACTDPFEDNDNDQTLAAIALGEDHTATIIGGDEDHYDVSALAGRAGSCTVSFALPASSKQVLALSAYSASGTFVTSADMTAGSGDKTLTVTWSDDDVRDLRVRATSHDCQPYTIRCQAN